MKTYNPNAVGSSSTPPALGFLIFLCSKKVAKVSEIEEIMKV